MTIAAEAPIRVYADTSVYGGVFDDVFAEPSKAFFENVRDGRFQLVVSVLVEEELTAAPQKVRDLFRQIRVGADSVSVTEDALALRQAYLDAAIVSPKYVDDALHVALATIAQCTIIVSWNFRHIVHYQKVPLYNAVNVLRRCPAIEILSPLQIIERDEI
jgi:predicted nucleic acid-binding protein